jgi:hypothetical protein
MLTKTELSLLLKAMAREGRPCGLIESWKISGNRKYTENARAANALRNLAAKGLITINDTVSHVEPKYNSATLHATEYSYTITPAGITAAQNLS